MHVLVTGGAGYLGSVMVPRFLREGYAVTIVDNFMYGQSSLLDCCHYPGLEIIRGNARSRPLVSELVRKADAIVPLACFTGAPLCERDPIGARAVNLEAVKMILELKSRNQLLVFPNTNSGYGTRDGEMFCTEDTPLQPISLYGRLKMEAEEAVLSAPATISLRLATVFGVSPRMRLDLLVNDFTYRAVTDGFVVLFEAHFKRNYVHVRDVARAFIHSLVNFDLMKGEPYNVGLSDANLSKRELCEEIRKQCPGFRIIEAEVGRDPDQRNYIVSNAKIESTGFKSEVSIEMGIKELLKAYQVIRRQGYSNV